jgi:hypothetical protein
MVQFMVQGVLIMMMFRVASRERNGSVGLCKTLLSHFQMLVRSTAEINLSCSSSLHHTDP